MHALGNAGRGPPTDGLILPFPFRDDENAYECAWRLSTMLFGEMTMTMDDNGNDSDAGRTTQIVFGPIEVFKDSTSLGAPLSGQGGAHRQTSEGPHPEITTPLDAILDAIGSSISNASCSEALLYGVPTGNLEVVKFLLDRASSLVENPIDTHAQNAPQLVNLAKKIRDARSAVIQATEPEAKSKAPKKA